MYMYVCMYIYIYICICKTLYNEIFDLAQGSVKNNYKFNLYDVIIFLPLAVIMCMYFLMLSIIILPSHSSITSLKLFNFY